jgi:hypothetical protein
MTTYPVATASVMLFIGVGEKGAMGMHVNFFLFVAPPNCLALFLLSLAIRSEWSHNNPSDGLSPFLDIPNTTNLAKYLSYCLK